MTKQNTKDEAPSKTNFAKPMLPACGIRSWKKKLSKLSASLKNKIVALCPTIDKLSFGLKNKGSKFELRDFRPQSALLDEMSKKFDDEYGFVVRLGLKSQDEFNEIKSRVIYFKLKSHFLSPTSE